MKFDCDYCGKTISTEPGAVNYCDLMMCRMWRIGMVEPKEARDPLLVEREKTHGSFRQNAETFRKLCDAMGQRLPDPQQEMAVGMILVKLSRLVQTPHVKDHWDDIAGYAKLGAEACE